MLVKQVRSAEVDTTSQLQQVAAATSLSTLLVGCKLSSDTRSLQRY